MNEKYRPLSPEVYCSNDAITTVNQADIGYFKQMSAHNPRKRARLCAHGDLDDRLHEMLIALDSRTYVRPHKHPGKSESAHIIEGMVDVVVFDDDGRIEHVIHLGDYASGRTFYYRMATPVFHTLIIRSDVLVFHETTNGPFDRKDTVFAPWAPEEDDVDLISTFMADLDDRVRLMQ